jgi:membrane-associated phospholipid phosphatase
VLVGALLAWGAWNRRWAWIVAAALAVAVTDPLVSRVIKPAIGRERPCRAYAIDPCGSGEAMPSAHAANMAALATATASPPLAGMAVLVGVSRVVSGQHWPTDVAAGWALGAVLGAGIGAGVRAGAARIGARGGREG